MVFKHKKVYISPRFFSLLIIIFAVILFVTSINFKESSVCNAKIKFKSFSINYIFEDVSKKIFKNDLISRSRIIDNLAGFIFKKKSNISVKKTIDDIKLKVDFNFNKNKFNSFRNKYLEFSENNDNNSFLFGITPVHSVFKPCRWGSNLPKPVNEIEVAVCKGEWESTQILIVPFCDSIFNISISVNGERIDLGKVECFSGEYAYCDYSAYTLKEGWYADPLAPINFVSSTNNSIDFIVPSNLSTIKANEVKSLWLNYYIPYNIEAGIYNFEIIVNAESSDKKDYAKVNIKLNVFDYEMPKTMHLKTAFSFDKRAFLKYYNIDSISKELDKEHYSFFLKYRLNPTSIYTDIYNTYPPLDDWQWCIDRGANFFNLGYLGYIPEGNKNELNNYESELIDKINYLRTNNLMQYAYIYGFDEVTPPNYNKLKQMVKFLREINNEIPFVSTVKPVDELKNYVDIWVPLTSMFSEQTKKYKSNEELWWYVCCIPYHPYANFFIEYPAIAPRIIFWQASKYNIEGFLYYLINSWSYNNNVSMLTYEKNPFIDEIRKGKKWPDVPWSGHSFRWNDGQRFYNGDGQLIYPGKNMQLCPSVRLINIRDGIEDYEIFSQIKLKIKNYRTKNEHSTANILEEFLTKAYLLTPSNKEYVDNPEKMLELKKEALILLTKY